MSAPSGQAVQLAEGNQTLRELMGEILEEEGLRVVENDATDADLLVVDVDSPGDIPAERIDDFLATNRPVLLLGLRQSRADFPEADWLSRPFHPTDFVARCRESLGLEERSFPGIDESEDHDSTTREVNYDSPEMEEELGEEVDTPVEAVEESDESLEVDDADFLEIDDASSMVLDVQDISEDFFDGGSLGDEPESETLDISALSTEAESLDFSFSDMDAQTNPTLPDVPSQPGAGDEAGVEDSSGIQRHESTTGPRPGAAGSTGAHADPSTDSRVSEPDAPGETPVPVANDPRNDSSLGPVSRGDDVDSGRHAAANDGSDSPGMPFGPNLGRALGEIANLMAESWSKIGLTARWEDRAERLRRVFDSFVERGVEGATEELGRIPPAHGFSGTLDVFPAFELIRTIRERRWLGRLEISNDTGGYVLYFDGGLLVGIDDLEGRSEAMLLDCLRQSKSVDSETYDKLRGTVENSLAAPLEMKLRTEQLVSDTELLEARQVRAKWVMKEVLLAPTGTFAFIRGGDESGQPWPVNELGLQVDLLMLELLRESEIDQQSGMLSDHDRVVTDATRFEQCDGGLSETERRVMEAAVEPIAVGQLVARGDEWMTAAQNLFAVGLLERIGSSTPASEAKASSSQMTSRPDDGSDSEPS